MAWCTPLPRLMLSVALASLLPLAATKDNVAKHNIPHSRQRRVLWITNDGRLALPPGTTLVITPSISMPFVRYPPEGFFSNMTISLPFTIDFDKLGLTDNENPYGTLPPVFARSMGRAAGSAFADYVGKFLNFRRGKRSTGPELTPEVEQYIMSTMHGGERALLYILAEELLMSFGMPGKSCLLRAICEIHVHSLKGYGFMGEVLRLFLTPSKSEHAELLTDYVQAEKVGMEIRECFSYFKECPKGLFKPASSKYLENGEEHHAEDEDHENKIDDAPTFRM